LLLAARAGCAQAAAGVSSVRSQAKRSVLGRFMLRVRELVFLQTLGLQRFALLRPATPEIKVAVASVFFSMEMFVIVKLILKIITNYNC
jgi:hypothetical protein